MHYFHTCSVEGSAVTEVAIGVTQAHQAERIRSKSRPQRPHSILTSFSVYKNRFSGLPDTWVVKLSY